MEFVLVVLMKLWPFLQIKPGIFGSKRLVFNELFISLTDPATQSSANLCIQCAVGSQCWRTWGRRTAPPSTDPACM